jgi:5-methylcytosine-specific restriction endonuclease McrA
LPGDNPRHTVAWQRIRRRVVAAARLADLPCAHCGGAIAYNLGGRHPYGPHVDHIVALALAPDQPIDAAMVRVLHAHCNLSLGGKLGRASQLDRAKPRRAITADRW